MNLILFNEHAYYENIIMSKFKLFDRIGKLISVDEEMSNFLPFTF